ncbi:MAG: putative addiction module antidote protein [Deltaproteobacteria bacterium]|nr:putative addiction module antidote protein [Deltaproteobacteria bacterium]
MPRSIDYNKRLLKQLRDPDEAAAYLNAVLAEGDLKLFIKALGKIAEARGGMTQLAEKTRVSRMGLYKVFSDRGNPGFATVESILSAFNLRFSIQPGKAPAR